MEMYFNVPLKGEQATAWLMELRHTVKGWKYDPESESDPIKSDKAKSVKSELCDVLRFINEMDVPPRKSRGKANGESRGKFTAADVQLWVWLYRKSQNQKTGFDIDMQFVEAGKRLIQRCIDKGQPFIAAIVATGSPAQADREDFNSIFADLGNRGFTEQEQGKITEFCVHIGFDPYQAIREDPSCQKHSESPVGSNQFVSKAVESVAEDCDADQLF
jgi:hypothetical protein